MAGPGRLAREDWIATAREALISSGVDEVKVDVLAHRLKVSRGSFYWHFKNRQGLLDALLDDWKANNRREIEAIEAVVAQDGQGWTELFRVWLGEDPAFPAFDFAIRGWARKAQAVSRLVREIDDAWISVLQANLEREGVKPPESLVRARIMYFHQVGYFALSLDETLDARVRLAPYYYEALTGLPAPQGLVEDLLASKTAKAQGAAPTEDRPADEPAS